MADKITKTDAQWRAELNPEQYRVLREHGTERTGTSPLNNENAKGMYICAGCGAELFPSDTKYDSGTGWPSYYAPTSPDAVSEHVDKSWFSTRTEVRCAKCDGHFVCGCDPGIYRRTVRPDAQRVCSISLMIKS